MVQLSLERDTPAGSSPEAWILHHRMERVRSHKTDWQGVIHDRISNLSVVHEVMTSVAGKLSDSTRVGRQLGAGTRSSLLSDTGTQAAIPTPDSSHGRLQNHLILDSQCNLSLFFFWHLHCNQPLLY